MASTAKEIIAYMESLRNDEQRMSMVCTWKTSQQGGPYWCLRYASKARARS